MARLEATPTEYRGIQFRSKCEAMFALCIDYQSKYEESYTEYFRNQNDEQWFVNAGTFIWRYEPELNYMPGFCCDFEICSLNFRNNDIPELRHRFIEYKPSVPTQTYCNRFFKKYVDAMIFCDTKGLTEVSRKSEAVIFYGSIYTRDRGKVTLSNDGSIQTKEIDWIHPQEDAIRNYRFDLAVQQ